MEGRNPKASGQMSTPAWAPFLGRMNAASQVPSGVLISTSVSTTASAPAAFPAAAVKPAVTDSATKSRRAISPEFSLMVFLLYLSLSDRRQSVGGRVNRLYVGRDICQR